MPVYRIWRRHEVGPVRFAARVAAPTIDAAMRRLRTEIPPAVALHLGAADDPGGVVEYGVTVPSRKDEWSREFCWQEEPHD